MRMRKSEARLWERLAPELTGANGVRGQTPRAGMPIYKRARSLTGVCCWLHKPRVTHRCQQLGLMPGRRLVGLWSLIVTSRLLAGEDGGNKEAVARSRTQGLQVRLGSGPDEMELKYPEMKTARKDAR